ncbi:MAG: transglycosylase SLT domain-containing protein [Chloroflexi bacterium]|nr:transglycosylase SLT domain-containing protein [Chloroflexota bacterium]
MSEDHEAPEELSNPEQTATPLDRLPSALRNWQVIEIDGEATRVEDARPTVEPPAATPSAAIPEHADDVIVVGLDTRQLTVNAGGTVTWHCSLLNNGPSTALFTVQLEGWVDEHWFTPITEQNEPTPAVWPVQILLQPGERANVGIEIAPPRAPEVSAGEHPLALVVRAPEYPERFNRLAATLTIAPYTDLGFGPMQPKLLAISWFKRSGLLSLPLTNRSNIKLNVRLQGLPKAKRQWQIEFGPVNAPQSHYTLTLQPGQKVQIPVHVSARNLPLFALRKRNARLPIQVATAETSPPARTINAEIVYTSLIGPWQLTAVFSFFLLTIIGLGLALIMGLLLWRSMFIATKTNPPAPVQTPAILPMIALVVNVPAATPIPSIASKPPVNTLLGQTLQTPFVNGDLANPGPAQTITAPMVQAAQVTGPGTPAPFANAPAAIVLVPTPQPVPKAQPVRHNMTYQQMFQEIGHSYDLNWRMLAAQAYIESSFDSVALSQQGAMGLMQILPGTWQEWAPAVKASDPMDSYSNVLVAAIYLDYLRTTLSQHGHPQVEWMLVAYNWGIDKVLRHLDSGQSWEDLPQERRQYAEDILRIAGTIPAN